MRLCVEPSRPLRYAVTSTFWDKLTANMHLPDWMTQSDRDAQEDAAVWRSGGSGFPTDVVDWFWGEQQPIIRVLRRRAGLGSSPPKETRGG